MEPSELSEAVRNQLAGSPVYDFNLSVNGNKITQFSGNDVKISFGYTLKQGEDPNKVVVCFIDDLGYLQIIKNGKYIASTGQVEFKAKHFSKYTAIMKNSKFQDLKSVPWAIDSIQGLEAREIVRG